MLACLNCFAVYDVWIFPMPGCLSLRLYFFAPALYHGVLETCSLLALLCVSYRIVHVYLLVITTVLSMHPTLSDYMIASTTWNGLNGPRRNGSKGCCPVQLWMLMLLLVAGTAARVCWSRRSAVIYSRCSYSSPAITWCSSTSTYLWCITWYVARRLSNSTSFLTCWR